MNKKVFTSLQKKKIKDRVLSISKAKDFFHCKSCEVQFDSGPLKQSMTLRDFGLYEISKYAFLYPGKKKSVDIVVVWCKRCGRNIWDNRLE